MKKLTRNPLFWLTLTFILPVLSWFIPGMPVVHDGQDHVARIANFYAALTDGNIVPRWAANLNWGYGHPILMFLYPLPSYLASLFHGIGFSLVTSTKLVFIVSFVASGVAMYLWLKTAFSVRVGIVGSLLYTFAPYRFVDLNVRGALGEHVAFIFPPLILYFLQKQSYMSFSFALAALILSHNAIALLFIPIILLYALCIKKLFTFHFSLFTFFGFTLSAFFWIPALLEGKFTLRYIVTAGEALERFVPWHWFFYSPWNYGGGDTLTKSLGFAQWIGVAASVWLLITSKTNKLRMLLSVTIMLLLLSLLLMTEWSSFVWEQSKILQNFQFPWRFLSLSVFLAAVLGGVAISKLKINRFLFIAYCLLLIFSTSWMWRPKGFAKHDDSFYSGVYFSTTDTGESSPIWSTRFMEHTAANPLEVVDGDANIRQTLRTTTVHEYEIDVKKPTLMLENTVYFPGWMIYLDGQPTGIQFQNPDYRGLMLFRVTEENNHVRVVFEDTKVRKAANMISLVSFAVVSGLYLWQKRNSLSH